MVKKKKPKIFLHVRWCFSIGPLSFTQWSNNFFFLKCKIKRKIPTREKRGDNIYIYIY